MRKKNVCMGFLGFESENLALFEINFGDYFHLNRFFIQIELFWNEIGENGQKSNQGQRRCCLFEQESCCHRTVSNVLNQFAKYRIMCYSCNRLKYECFDPYKTKQKSKKSQTNAPTRVVYGDKFAFNVTSVLWKQCKFHISSLNFNRD